MSEYNTKNNNEDSFVKQIQTNAKFVSFGQLIPIDEYIADNEYAAYRKKGYKELGFENYTDTPINKKGLFISQDCFKIEAKKSYSAVKTLARLGCEWCDLPELKFAQCSPYIELSFRDSDREWNKYVIKIGSITSDNPIVYVQQEYLDWDTAHVEDAGYKLKPASVSTKKEVALKKLATSMLSDARKILNKK